MILVLLILSWFVIGFLSSIVIEYDYQFGQKLINEDVSGNSIEYNWTRIFKDSILGYIGIVPAFLILFLHQDDSDAMYRMKKEKQIMKSHINKILNRRK